MKILNLIDASRRPVILGVPDEAAFIIKPRHKTKNLPEHTLITFGPVYAHVLDEPEEILRQMREQPAHE